MLNVRYTRLYTDEKGDTHFQDMELPCEEKVFAPPALPLGVSDFAPADRIGYITAEPGWVGEWHPVPRRQWLFYLIGQVEITVSDGEKRIFGSGDIVLLEDTRGIGHHSRVVGDQGIVNAVVQLPD